MNVKSVWGLVKDTGTKWWEDKAPRLGASLAFYTMLSLAPLLIIVVAVAGLVFGREAARGGLGEELQNLAGPQGAQVAGVVLENASQQPGTGIFATVAGVVMLLFGATGVFIELQDALNTVWGVQPPPGRGVWGFIKDRFLSFSMVLGVAFLLLVSLVFSTLLTAMGTYMGGLLPNWAAVLHVLHLLLSVGLLTLLFALMFKYLPDATIAWGDVWVGAAVTALLFTLGKFLIGLYLGSSGIGSTYGAAGSFAVFLIWVYYSAQILFVGAEFTRVWAEHHGGLVPPDEDAKRVVHRKAVLSKT